MIHREAEIIKWGIDRHILEGEEHPSQSTPLAQVRKTLEEVGELFEAIAEDNITKARDAIGDIIVTLIMEANMWGLTMEECIEAAWLEIKDRKGRMINGKFVKEADL